MEHNVNVLVVFFMGEKRVRQVSDPREFIKAHLDYFRENPSGVGRVTLILNSDGPEHEKMFLEAVEQYRPFPIDLKVMVRKNIGFSYGAWNDAINESIEAGEEFSHYMLLEDDYILNTPEAIEKFASQMTGDVGYVCQKLSDFTLQKIFGTQTHPGVACGMLLYQAAFDAHEKYGEALEVIVHQTDRYDWSSLQLQVHFIDYIVLMGYSLADISKISSVKFVHRSEAKHGFFMLDYGTPGLPEIIKPVVDWSLFKE